MDLLTNLTASLVWTALGLLVLLSLILFVRFVAQSSRANAKVETDFAETLAWVRSAAAGSRLRQASSVVSHRARRELPGWLRWGARRGAVKPQPGYAAPPPLTPEPVPPTWAERDRNSRPAVGQASVARQDRWEELDVARDVLAGRMRSAADERPTGLIEPIRAEVVQ